MAPRLLAAFLAPESSEDLKAKAKRAIKVRLTYTCLAWRLGLTTPAVCVVVFHRFDAFLRMAILLVELSFSRLDARAGLLFWVAPSLLLLSQLDVRSPSDRITSISFFTGFCGMLYTEHGPDLHASCSAGAPP